MARVRQYSVELTLVLILAGAVVYFGYLGYGLLTPAFVAEPFSGERAREYVARQVDYGPRPTGSPANIRMGDWLIEELRLLGWDVVVQPFTTPDNTPARNIIAIKSNTPAPARAAMLVTHYDTRLVADRDPELFARHTRELLDNTDRARAMGAAAAELGRRYTWSFAAARLRRLYTDVTSRSLVNCS